MRKKLSRNIKPGDIVICVNNIGHSTLIEGKEYVVVEYYKEYGSEHIRVIGYLPVFANRFLLKKELIKEQRLEKLNRLNNIKK